MEQGGGEERAGAGERPTRRLGPLGPLGPIGPRSPVGRSPALVALAWALLWIATSFIRALPSSLDEPLGLRWARAAADHPIRTAAALALLLPAGSWRSGRSGRS